MNRASSLSAQENERALSDILVGATVPNDSPAYDVAEIRTSTLQRYKSRFDEFASALDHDSAQLLESARLLIGSRQQFQGIKEIAEASSVERLSKAGTRGMVALNRLGSESVVEQEDGESGLKSAKNLVRNFQLLQLQLDRTLSRMSVKLRQEAQAVCEQCERLKEKLTEMERKDFLSTDLAESWLESLAEIEEGLQCDEKSFSTESYQSGVPFHELIQLVSEISKYTDQSRLQLPESILEAVAEEIGEQRDERDSAEFQKLQSQQRTLAKRIFDDIGTRTYLCITRYLDHQDSAENSEEQVFHRNATQAFEREVKSLLAIQEGADLIRHLEYWMEDERAPAFIRSGAQELLEQLPELNRQFGLQVQQIVDQISCSRAEALTVASQLSTEGQEKLFESIQDFLSRDSIKSVLRANPQLLISRHPGVQQHLQNIDQYLIESGLSNEQIAQNPTWFATDALLKDHRRMISSGQAEQHDFEFLQSSIHFYLGRETRVKNPEVAAMVLAFGFSPKVGQVILTERLSPEEIERNLRRHVPDRLADIKKPVLLGALQDLAEEGYLVSKRMKVSELSTAESKSRFSISAQRATGSAQEYDNILAAVLTVHDKYCDSGRSVTAQDNQKEDSERAEKAHRKAEIERRQKEQAEKAQQALERKSARDLERMEVVKQRAVKRLEGALGAVSKVHRQFKESVADGLVEDLKELSLWDSRVESARGKHLRGELSFNIKANPVERLLSRALQESRMSLNSSASPMGRGSKGHGRGRNGGKKSKGVQFKAQLKQVEQIHLVPLQSKVEKAFNPLRVALLEIVNATTEAEGKEVFSADDRDSLFQIVVPLRESLQRNMGTDKYEYFDALSQIARDVQLDNSSGALKLLSEKVSQILPGIEDVASRRES